GIPALDNEATQTQIEASAKLFALAVTFETVDLETTYLIKGRGVGPLTSGWLASLVLAGGAIGGTLGGFLSDALIRHTGNRKASRRGLGFASLASSGVLLLIGLHTDNATLAASWTALAVLAVNLTLASWWGAVADISGRHVGALFGLMNSLGGGGAVASQLVLGQFADGMRDLGFEGRDQWDPAFYIYAAILFVGAFGWLWIDTTRPVEPSPMATESSNGINALVSRARSAAE